MDLVADTMVICWGGRLCPFREDVKQARDVLDNLSGVLGAEITPETWLPDLACMVDQIVVLGLRWFH